MVDIRPDGGIIQSIGKLGFLVFVQDKDIPIFSVREVCEITFETATSIDMIEVVLCMYFFRSGS